MLELTDSHCHLALHDAPDEALHRARAAGVIGFMVPATKLDDAEPAIAIAERNIDVWAAVGFHPHEAKDFDDAAEAKVREWGRHERVVAIGEIGLDYHYDFSPREVQREVFRKQIAIARELNRPIIVHNRESTADMLEILTSGDVGERRGILHSFTETYDVAARLVDAGYYISFSGIVTFKSADMLRDVAKRLPHDRVLIETDTPYLAPVPHRGKDNEPAFVAKTAEQIAALWGVDLAYVGDVTTRNFEKAFGVKIPAR